MIEKHEDFLAWFIRVCAKTDIAKSDEEEALRYYKKPPYQERICRWIDKFYKPNYDDGKDS